jgi:hypothetical protein
VAAVRERRCQIGLGREPCDLAETELLLSDQDPEIARSEQRLELTFRHVPGRYCGTGRSSNLYDVAKRPHLVVSELALSYTHA